MKTIPKIKALLFAAVLLSDALPCLSHGAYLFQGGPSRAPYSLNIFEDGGNTAYWIMKNTTPLCTLAFAQSGGWLIADKTLNSDGSLDIVWRRNVISGINQDMTHLAVWRISSTGVLMSAATYPTSGWDYTNVGTVPVGDKLLVMLVGTDNPNSPLVTATAGPVIALWLLNPDGSLQRAFLFEHKVGTGWAVSTTIIGGGKDSDNFTILLRHDPNHLLAYYTFDGSGNWIGANTLPY